MPFSIKLVVRGQLDTFGNHHRCLLLLSPAAIINYINLACFSIAYNLYTQIAVFVLFFFVYVKVSSVTC